MGQGLLFIRMGHGNASFSPLSEHGTKEEKADVEAQDSDDDFMEAIKMSLCTDEGGQRRRFDRMTPAEKQIIISMAQLNFLKQSTEKSNAMVK